MANIRNLIGYNKQQTTADVLLAAYGNDVVNVTTGLGYSLNLNTTNDVEFMRFLDRIFIQNFDMRPLTFNGTAWTTEYVKRCMISKYLMPFKETIYLSNCKFSPPQTPLDSSNNAILFPSKVFYSDAYIGGGNITWGLEWGTNGKVTANTNRFNLSQPLVQDFIASNIKVGDPLYITNGDSLLLQHPYFVASIDSAYQLTMTENFPVTATSLHYWVGRNWFDVNTDDGDQITGFFDNTDRLLISKLLSLHYYTGGANPVKRRVKDSIGTSYCRSFINYKGYTYYFHATSDITAGIYRYDGVQSVKVSRAIDPFIRGMASASYSQVVAWREGEELRFYLGDLSNSTYEVNLSKAVATLNTVTNAWDVSPIGDQITSFTTWRSGNNNNLYCGNSNGEVLQMATGNSFNGNPINAILDTHDQYPEGTGVYNQFNRIQVIGRQTHGLRVKYKLWDAPKDIDDQWIGIGQCDADKTELKLPREHKFGSGISLRFDDSGVLKNDMYVEKITVFYIPDTKRITNQ